MSNTKALYQALRQGNPNAVAYYEKLKERIEDGKRAQLIMNAIQAVHTEHQASRASIGALPGVCITPNGRVLTPQALSQLVAACYAAASR
jgi:hypothetical protein